MHSRTILNGCCIALMAVGFSTAAISSAANPAPASQTLQFDIKPQPLASALNEFALQSHQQILFTPEIANGKTTRGAHGGFTPEAALKRLLAGTGLSASRSADGMVLVSQADAKGASAATDPPSAPSGAPSDQSQSNRFSGPTQAPVRLEEVIVTAQKREQRAFDVPMSISAITADEIASRGAATIEDLQFSVPGMSITEFSPGQQRIQMRGISVFGGLPTVGVYLNEMPLNGEFIQAGMDVRLVDVERIEVLRGPQGTLYGQGSMGGTVRYITTEPKLDTFGGRFEAEGASIDRGGVDWGTKGAINVPIVPDQFAVRLAEDYEHFGGWVHETLLGIPHANDGSEYTLRATGLWRPSDPFSVSMMLQHQVLHLNDQNLANADGTLPARITQPIRSRVDLADVTAKYDFGPAQLLSSTGWLDRRDSTNYDDSNSFIPFLETPPPSGFGLPPGSIQSVAYDVIATNRIFTEELRLSTTGQTRLGGTVGAFYRDSRTSTTQTEPVTPAILPITLFSDDGTNPENSRSWAVFGQGYYWLTPSLEATLGLRYFRDQQRQDTTSSFLGTTSHDQGVQTFTATSPRVDLSWHASDNLNLYASLTKGFRSGGFNLTSISGGLFPVPPTYAPETLWTYEIGGKFQSDNRRMVGELAVYHNNWKNVQSLTFPNGFSFQYTVNGGKVSGWGVDAQLTVRPVDPLTLQLTGGWNNMAYDSTSADHVPGDPADYVPRYTASASAEYRYHWTQNLPGFVRADYQRSDRFQVYIRSVMLAPADSDVLNFLNVRIGVEASGWTLSLVGKNITNDHGVLYPALGALPYPARPQPRTVGAAISKTF